MKKKSRTKRQKIEGEGLPRLLTTIQGEPLTKTVAFKLWPSLVKWLNNGHGAEFIRLCIIEKLQRLANKPHPAVCGRCNFLKRDSKPFCPQIDAFIDEGALNEPWDCEKFAPRREER